MSVVLNYLLSFVKTPNYRSEEDKALLAMEEGRGNRLITTSTRRSEAKDSQSIRIEEIKKAAASGFAKPVTIPNAAAGNAKHFLPRQEVLLKDQYANDEQGRPATKIGTICYQILERELGKELPSLMDINMSKSLEILSDQKGTTQLFREDGLGSSVTLMGKEYSLIRLTSPNPEIEYALTQKALLEEFLKVNDLDHDIREILTRCKGGEIALLSSWDSTKCLPGALQKLYYRYGEKWDENLNASSLALNISALSTNAKNILNTSVQVISCVAFPLFTLFELVRACKEAETPPILNGYVNRFAAGTPVGTFGTLALSANNPLVNAGTAAAVSFSLASSVRNSIDWTLCDYKMFPLIHSGLCDVATYYQGMKEIHALLEKHPEITRNLSFFHFLDDLIRNESSSPHIAAFQKLIESTTFRSKHQCFSHLCGMGDVLALYEFLHSGSIGKVEFIEKSAKKGKAESQTKAEQHSSAGDEIRHTLEGALLAMAEIDWMAARGSLISESEGRKTQYSIPEYSDSRPPILDLIDLWHPSCSQDSAAVNCFTMGGTFPNGVVLTGRNRGGKSTLTQAVTLAIATSSEGIVAARRAELSHFSQVSGSLKLTDSVDRGSSGMSEQSSLLQHMLHDATESKAPRFVLLDEACNQTEAVLGNEILTSYGEQFAKRPNCLTVIVTNQSAAAEELSRQIADNGASYFAAYQMADNLSHQMLPGIYVPKKAHIADLLKTVGTNDEIIQKFNV
ncbi:MAG TPA: hypothetical protein VJK48_06550 [Chlamydiales bacterium]|nr:hypothetical protein [Chlamydiales bacterium]